MSHAVTTRTFGMPKGQELGDLISFCKVMSESPFYKKLGPGGVMSIILTAKELNLPMMPCLNGGMHNINGCVSLSAQMMNSLILLNGHSADLGHLDETRCTIHFKRAGSDKIIPYTYTYEDAKKACYLGKDNWRHHLKDMLYCRCLSGGARKVMPDALMGCYIHGEMVNDDVQIMPDENLTINIKDEQPPEVKPEQIEFVKNKGFDEFAKEHDLFGECKKARFVREIAKTSKKTASEIINIALENQERFDLGFEKWDSSDKTPSKTQDSD